MTAIQSVGNISPFFGHAEPGGVCIQLLAERIQKAEIRVPEATMRVAAKCILGLTRFQPKSMTPRNEASRKKAVRTS
jgi:hypothetical protein